MLLAFILVVPIIAAVLVLMFKSRRAATAFAVVAGALELAGLALTVWRVSRTGSLELGLYLRADALTTFFLINLGAVFFLVLLYSTSYIRHIPAGRFSSPRWFYSLLFLFLFSIIAVYLANNLGFLWIMMEATTLASALLVGFYNTEGAIEAGWKYLIVCTVGLAFALFGTRRRDACKFPCSSQTGVYLSDRGIWNQDRTGSYAQLATGRSCRGPLASQRHALRRAPELRRLRSGSL